eukprot:731954-Alexandrium_andersonii.AAC.1
MFQVYGGPELAAYPAQNPQSSDTESHTLPSYWRARARSASRGTAYSCARAGAMWSISETGIFTLQGVQRAIRNPPYAR